MASGTLGDRYTGVDRYVVSDSTLSDFIRSKIDSPESPASAKIPLSISAPTLSENSP